MQHEPSSDVFEVFFDGQCPLCKREIDLIRWKDKKTQKLKLIDIASEDFAPGSYQKTLDEFHREIHGRDSDGNWLTGVDVFREIYRRIGFAPLVGISNLPIVRSLLSFGYRGFAAIRYRTAIRRIQRDVRSKRSQSCEQQCSPLGESR